MTASVPRSTWVALAVAAGAVAVVVGVVVSLWSEVGASQISPAGWFAMALGIMATLALGIGLMALVFISSRRGYDDPGGGDRR
jgi:hypothetical protein